MVKVAFLMSNYGHDPTETAIPYHEFKKAGYDIHFVTERGNPPECDRRMTEGWTQRLLGANCEAVDLYRAMREDLTTHKTATVVSWSEEGFTLDPYDLVFLPGGHDKGIVQVVNSPIVHRLLAAYFPQTQKPSKKSCAAICHGVLNLSESMLPASEETKVDDGKSPGKSVLHDATTTTLPNAMEQGIFWATRAVLGDYYKTYGASSESVETSVKKRLDDPKQFHGSMSMSPFIRRDEKYNYISGRFPPDAHLLAQATVEMVDNVLTV